MQINTELKLASRNKGIQICHKKKQLGYKMDYEKKYSEHAFTDEMSGIFLYFVLYIFLSNILCTERFHISA